MTIIAQQKVCQELTPHKLSDPLQELTKPCHNMQGLKISLQRVKHNAGGCTIPSSAHRGSDPL